MKNGVEKWVWDKKLYDWEKRFFEKKNFLGL